MKLLLDANLSHRILASIRETYPGSLHVLDAGLQSAGDDEVWDYARSRGCAVVSKDADFHQRSLLLGAPPKFIWIRLGNCVTEEIRAILLEHKDRLLAFDADPDAAFLTLG